MFNSRLKLIATMRMRFMTIKFYNNLKQKANKAPIMKKTFLKKRLIYKNELNLI